MKATCCVVIPIAMECRLARRWKAGNYMNYKLRLCTYYLFQATWLRALEQTAAIQNTV